MSVTIQIMSGASCGNLALAHKDQSCALPNVMKQLLVLGTPNAGLRSKKGAERRPNYRLGRRSWLLPAGGSSTQLRVAGPNASAACATDAGSSVGDQRDNSTRPIAGGGAGAFVQGCKGCRCSALSETPVVSTRWQSADHLGWC